MAMTEEQHEPTTGKANNQAAPTRTNLYAQVARHLPKAIEVLVDLMQHSRNEPVRMGAAKALLDKGLPDVKAVEIGGEQGGPILIKIVSESNVYGTGTDSTANQELSKATDDFRL